MIWGCMQSYSVSQLLAFPADESITRTKLQPVSRFYGAFSLLVNIFLILAVLLINYYTWVLHNNSYISRSFWKGYHTIRCMTLKLRRTKFSIKNPVNREYLNYLQNKWTNWRSSSLRVDVSNYKLEKMNWLIHLQVYDTKNLV